MNSKNILAEILSFATCLLLSFSAEASEESTSYDEFFHQKKETAKGLFTLHKMDGKLYFEIPMEQLGKDMLLGSTISEISDNGNAIIGQKPADPLLFRFQLMRDRILMTLPDQDHLCRRPDGPIARALEKSAKDAIYRSFKIQTWRPDSSAAVIDVTDLFLNDEKRFSPFDPYSPNLCPSMSRSESFSREKSFVKEIKAFEDNVSVKSVMTYTYSITMNGKPLLEDAPFTALMTRSIILLDPEGYRPRITDSRVAIFPTQKIIYDEEVQRTRPIYFANRWRLEPSDSAAFAAGELTPPVKPIVFYLDNHFPLKWKKYIREGISQWNEVFEEIGFRDAVVVRDFPENDPEFDPDNLKYSCVRYAPLPVENAMGPSWTDPRTGEILNASVYVYHDVVKLLNNWLFVQTAAVDPRVRTMEMPETLMGDALRYVISHEVGHCLGFMHNMGASATFPTDSLRSPSFTQKNGTTPSIMDYARFNYVAQPGDLEKGVRLTPPRFGEYDRFLVKWNYTPLPQAADSWEEYEITSGWLKEASRNPVLRYGKQQQDILDPRSQSEDLGDDPVKSSRYGISNLKIILAHLNEWIGEEDYDYSHRSGLYDQIILQYFLYVNHVYAQIGGIHLYEKQVGDAVPRFQTVAASRQREALEFLLTQLDELDWIDEASVQANLGLMGSPADNLRDLIIKMILSTPDKVDLAAGKAATDPFTTQECMDMIFKHIWKPTLEKKSLTPLQIKLQKLFLRNIGQGAMMKIGPESPNALCEQWAVSPTAGYEEPFINYQVPQQYEGLYFGYVLKVRDLLEKRLRHGDEATRHHYQWMLRNIEKAL